MATLGGNRHSGASWEGKKGPPAFGARRVLEGAAPSWHSTWVPLGFLPASWSFSCRNNPPFSPLCISPEVQQSSFYGYTGLLPKRYTQGVMTGESKYPQALTESRSPCMDLHLLLGPQRVTPGSPLAPAQPSWVCQQIRDTPGCSHANQGVYWFLSPCTAMSDGGWGCLPGASSSQNYCW